MSRFKQFGKKILGQKIRIYGIWLALILICVALAIFSDTFFTMTNLANVGRQVSVNIIIACGMTIVIITGGIDLSVGALLAFSSFIMADIMKSTVLGLGLCAGLVAGVLMGMINGFIVSRRKSMAFVVTLGTMTIWRSFTAIYSGGLPISDFSASFENIAAGNFLFFPIPFWIAIFTVVLCKFLLEWTKFGKYAYAIGSNTTAAKNCGVNVRAIITAAYMICGGLAALAGIVLTSRLGAAQPQGGLGYEMDGIAAVVIGGTSLSGGRGRITGTLAGALVMGVLRNGLNLLGVSSNWQQTVMGVVIIVAILWDKGDQHVVLTGAGKADDGGEDQ